MRLTDFAGFLQDVKIRGKGDNGAAASSAILSAARHWPAGIIHTMDVTELLSYADWSRKRLRSTIEEHPEVWDREYETILGFKSIRALTAHLGGAEERWLMRILLRPQPDLSYESRSGPSVADVFEGWNGIRLALWDFVRTAGPEELSAVHKIFLPSIGLDVDMRVDQMLWQIFNHQTYHLGQISTAFQRWSIDPPNFDVVLMLGN